MKQLFSQIVAAVAGLWAASVWVPGVMVRVYPDSNFFGFPITAVWEMVVLLGIILGVLNYCGKLFVDTFPLPFHRLSVAILSCALGIVFLFLLDSFFAELYLPWWQSLCYTGVIIWLINLLIETLIIHPSY